MKNTTLFGFFLLTGCFVTTSCVKKEMAVSTGSVSNITLHSATVAGTIIDIGGGATKHGHCYSKTKDADITDNIVNNGKPAGLGNFTSELSNLEPGTKYYVKAFLGDDKKTVYGTEISFMTIAVIEPVMTTTAISDISSTSAGSGGNISSDGGAPVTGRGVCWSTSQNPTTSDSKTTDGQGTGSFISNLANLQPGTTYYVRAYAINSAGPGYGNELTFTTLVLVVAPVVTTGTTSATSSATATSGGNVTSDGGAPVTARGVCWSTGANPTVALGTKTSDGTGTGTFTSDITGLTPNTLYHVRAYATNSAGTSYGTDVTITTPVVAVIPTLTTGTTAATSPTSAISGGNITDDGGGSVTARGVCWATTQNPTLSNSFTTNGAGTGSFTSNITGLLQGTTYYVRAYATNVAGTAYGNQLIFNTKITDIDGNSYNTVKIGTQVWMAENLKTTRYLNYDSIGTTTPVSKDILLETDPKYQWSYGGNENYVTDYGRLYTWYAITDSRGICPTGWHIPEDDEYTTLIAYLLGETVAGGKLKEAGFDHWASPNTGASNESGFTALPGGYRFTGGSFGGLCRDGLWWSSTGGSLISNAWILGMGYNYTEVYMNENSKRTGYSVRCVKD